MPDPASAFDPKEKYIPLNSLPDTGYSRLSAIDKSDMDVGGYNQSGLNLQVTNEYPDSQSETGHSGFLLPEVTCYLYRHTFQLL